MLAVARRTPPPAAVRRRRLAVLGAAVAALLAGVAVGAGAGGGDTAPGGARAPGRGPRTAGEAARAAVDRLTPAQQAGQLVVLRFAGTAAPGYVTRRLREGRVAGAILFRDNAATPQQVSALAGALRRAAGRPAPVICVDQEGAGVRILPWAPPARSQAAQAAAGRAGADARAAAQALRAEGVNVALAPVADVPSVSGSALAGRAFSADPAAAGAAVAASVRGWLAGGVAPTLKHFPGLGGATVNTDDAPSTVPRSRAALQDDLAPFRAGIAAGAPLVMVSSARYPALDAGHVAAHSRAVVEEELRGRLGFRGVAMTDSLEAAAMRATGDLDAAAVAAVDAGVDLVLTTGRGSYIRVYRALLARARTDPAFRARVRESAARVLALRARLR
jgi:beta-N-acetylhexosaminidase